MIPTMTLRPFERVARDTTITRNPRFFGPEPDHYCPCGSRRKARSCHRAADHSWVAERPRPLITGERTGYANPNCYGRAGNDCSKSMTREHFISAHVLQQIRADDATIEIGGTTWIPAGESRAVGINALTSKILCARHNHALSPLDNVAGQYFEAMRLDAKSMMSQGRKGEFPCAFTMICGPMLELWLLKVLFGAVATESIRLADGAAYRFRLGVTTAQLTDILWRGQEWPSRWGLYVPTTPVTGPTRMLSTHIRFVSVGPEILGGGVMIAGLEYLIAFEPPNLPAIHRPAVITFQRRGYKNWKMAALCWPEQGHLPINVVSQRGRGEDSYSPPDDSVGVVDLGRRFGR